MSLGSKLAGLMIIFAGMYSSPSLGGKLAHKDLMVAFSLPSFKSTPSTANLPSLLSTNASQLYATNISTLLFHLTTKDGLNPDLEEEITKGVLITHQGQLVHPFTKSILNK